MNPLTYIEGETPYLCRKESPLPIKQRKPLTYIENEAPIKKKKPLTYIEEEDPYLYTSGRPIPIYMYKGKPLTCIEEEAGVLLGSEVELHSVGMTANGVSTLHHEIVENVFRTKECHL